MIGTEDLCRRFNFHPAATGSIEAAIHADVRAACLDLAGEIDLLCPDGREKSTAITKLEEVMMWANAAIARERVNP